MNGYGTMKQEMEPLRRSTVLTANAIQLLLSKMLSRTQPWHREQQCRIVVIRNFHILLFASMSVLDVILLLTILAWDTWPRSASSHTERTASARFGGP
jgi:hypothetical protein